MVPPNPSIGAAHAESSFRRLFQGYLKRLEYGFFRITPSPTSCRHNAAAGPPLIPRIAYYNNRVPGATRPPRPIAVSEGYAGLRTWLSDVLVHHSSFYYGRFRTEVNNAEEKLSELDSLVRPRRHTFEQRKKFLTSAIGSYQGAIESLGQDEDQTRLLRTPNNGFLAKLKELRPVVTARLLEAETYSAVIDDLPDEQVLKRAEDDAMQDHAESGSNADKTLPDAFSSFTAFDLLAEAFETLLGETFDENAFNEKTFDPEARRNRIYPHTIIPSENEYEEIRDIVGPAYEAQKPQDPNLLNHIVEVFVASGDMVSDNPCMEAKCLHSHPAVSLESVC